MKFIMKWVRVNGLGRLKVLEKFAFARFFEMDENGIASRSRNFFADNGSDVVPVLMEYCFTDGIDPAGRIGRAFGRRDHRVRFRLFAHEGREVHEHGVMALGAADPEIFLRWFSVFRCDSIDSIGIMPLSFADDLLSGRAGAFGAEHESGDVFGAASGAARRRFRCSFRSQSQIL